MGGAASGRPSLPPYTNFGESMLKLILFLFFVGTIGLFQGVVNYDKR